MRDTIELSWQELADVVDGLVDAVRDDGSPSVILAVQRGGLVPAVILAHALQVRALVTIDIRSTVDDTPYAEKLEPRSYGGSIPSLENEDVLLVDDIAATGRTIQLAQQLAGKAAPGRLRTLVCLVNNSKWNELNVGGAAQLITYMGQDVSKWVRFPWDRAGDVA